MGGSMWQGGTEAAMAVGARGGKGSAEAVVAVGA